MNPVRERFARVDGNRLLSDDHSAVDSLVDVVHAPARAIETTRLEWVEGGVGFWVSTSKASVELAGVWMLMK